jgi:hypothetical protein
MISGALYLAEQRIGNMILMCICCDAAIFTRFVAVDKWIVDIGQGGINLVVHVCKAASKTLTLQPPVAPTTLKGVD